MTAKKILLNNTHIIYIYRYYLTITKPLQSSIIILLSLYIY